jgi:hypothetical protein
MKIINKTGHDVIAASKFGTHTFAPEFPNIRISYGYVNTQTEGCVNIYDTVALVDTSLPPELPDTYYIVSAVVARSFPMRKDFVLPHGQLKDCDGVVKACRGFSRIVDV